MSALAFVGVTALLGWAALYPARRALGPWAYLTMSWPLGLLAWPVAAAACSLLGKPVTVPWIAIGALAFVGLTAAGFATAARGSEGHETPLWAWAIHLALLATLTLVVWRLRLFFVTDDSRFGYQALGLLLHDTGIITQPLAEGRGLLIPSMHAAYLSLGGDMLVAAYPVTAAHVVSALALAVNRFSFARLRPLARTLATVGVAAALVTGNLFVFHALYVHSHMLTACYLLLGVLAVAAAHASSDAEALPWLAAGGLAAAGVVLARPDGLTYAFILAAFAVGAFFESGARPMRLAAFFTPLLAVLAVTFAAVFARLGVWHGLKLSGPVALAQIGALALVPLAALAIARRKPWAEGLSRRGATIRVALVLLAAALVVLAALQPGGFLLAVRTMATNLFSTGGWGLFWPFATGVVLLALAFRGIRRRAADSTEILGVLGLFLGVALIIHGTSHPGRLGAADSFNRIAFHTVPLVWWLAASLVGSALHDARRTGILN